MLKRVFSILLILISVSFNARTLASVNKDSVIQPVLFTENKGQVSDQYFQPRPDILFGGMNGELAFHLRRTGISWQLNRVTKLQKNDLPQQMGLNADRQSLIPSEMLTERIDVEWPGVNANAEILRDEAVSGVAHYYLASCPNGAHDVRSYQKLTYVSLYPGIDLQWYSVHGKLKYDYLLSPGADASRIQLQFKGAKKISINDRGELVIRTKHGEIVEQSPVAFQQGRTISCKWKLDRDAASFEISAYDPSLPLRIDPGVRLWGTYYGGTSTDVGWASAIESNGNIYNAGYSSSQGGTLIATVGSHQSVHGGGLENAYLAKFTSSGTRIWATYYGGNVRDVGVYCSLDPSGNIFLCGHTLSSNAIASPGAHQNSNGGSWDAFLVKFNSAGVRQWGTFYGGAGIEFGVSCAAAMNGSGDVYLCGKTDTPGGNVIATPGAHQTVQGGDEDAYLVKFNSAGVRQWGTYYGDACTDQGNHVATDNQGFVYMLGCTCSSLNISTPGAFQTQYSANFDAFIAKFNNSGIRQWSTYCGGNGDDRPHGLARDRLTGDLFIGGRTASTNSIATDGAHQTNFAGGLYDGFLMKLNASGSQRSWGTYYGGPDEDLVFGVAMNPSGHIYIGGYAGVNSPSLSTPGSHQPLHGGGQFDGLIAQFDSNGNRLWASYYGGSGYDVGQGISCDNNYNIYFTGLADAAGANVISTAGAHQVNYMGGGCDAFLVKFYDCSPPPQAVNITPLSSQTLCAGNSTSLIASSYGNVNWYTVPSGGTSLLTSTILPTSTLSAGNFTWYAEANTCTNSVIRTAIQVSVSPLPNINVISSTSLLCMGSTAYLSGNGASSYTWNTGSNSNSIAVSPAINTTYTLSGTGPDGCMNSVAFTQSVTVCTSLDLIGVADGEFRIYPQPSKDQLIIDGLRQGDLMELFDISGRRILHQIAIENGAVLDLNSFPAQVFLLKISRQGESAYRKVVKD